jgi:hypothetical protein
MSQRRGSQGKSSKGKGSKVKGSKVKSREQAGEEWRHGRTHLAVHDGEVELLGLALRELLRDAPVCEVALGHNDRPGRESIQPVDDPRARSLAGANR